MDLDRDAAVGAELRGETGDLSGSEFAHATIERGDIDEKEPSLA